MIDLYLHGFGSSAARFRRIWEMARRPTPDSLFLDGYQPDPLTGQFRWFPMSGAEPVLARRVTEVADRLTCDIAARIGAQEIRLFGHSQGGMIALELVRRGELPIVFAEVFAAYLPLAESAGAWYGRPACAVLHSSNVDAYIAPDQIERTVAAMAAADIPVTSRVRHGTAHAFSPEWLAPTCAAAA